MTITNTEFTKIALFTESVVDKFTVNKETFDATLEAFVAASEIIDLYKRSVYYTGYQIDRDKLAKLVVNLEGAASWLRAHVDQVVDGEKTDLKVNTRTAHGIIGMATEVGEVVDAFRQHLAKDTLDVINVAEEVGDVNYYEAVLVDSLGTSIDDCNAAVVRKLQKRYPDGFSSDKALNRDLDVERASLEKDLEQLK